MRLRAVSPNTQRENQNKNTHSLRTRNATNRSKLLGDFPFLYHFDGFSPAGQAAIPVGSRQSLQGEKEKKNENKSSPS